MNDAQKCVLSFDSESDPLSLSPFILFVTQSEQLRRSCN